MESKTHMPVGASQVKAEGSQASAHAAGQEDATQPGLTSVLWNLPLQMLELGKH